jgi:hypothetical protein
MQTSAVSGESVGIWRASIHMLPGSKLRGRAGIGRLPLGI